MSHSVCPICESELFAGHRPWHFQCRNCDYEKADLHPKINVYSEHRFIDEDARQTALKDLRVRNFTKLLTDIKSLKPNGGRLLDVGCAYGWFLETAQNDFAVLGLEPDEEVFEVASKKRLPVRMGYFPNTLKDNETFDVIVFNDVIEHIPDIENVLKHCRRHLNEKGLLALNLPCSKGIIYQLSKKLCVLGFAGFFERLWQKDLPSPHVHYFNRQNLTSLLKKSDFDSEITGSLSTLSLEGLYERLSYTGQYSTAFYVLLYLGIILLFPILRILPSDIIYIIARRN